MCVSFLVALGSARYLTNNSTRQRLNIIGTHVNEKKTPNLIQDGTEYLQIGQLRGFRCS